MHIGYGPTARESCYSGWFCTVVLVHTHFCLMRFRTIWLLTPLPVLGSRLLCLICLLCLLLATRVARIERATHLGGLMGFGGISFLVFDAERPKGKANPSRNLQSSRPVCQHPEKVRRIRCYAQTATPSTVSILESTLLPDHKSLKSTQHGTYQLQIPAWESSVTFMDSLECMLECKTV